jgi:hypothetical protein
MPLQVSFSPEFISVQVQELRIRPRSNRRATIQDGIRGHPYFVALPPLLDTNVHPNKELDLVLGRLVELAQLRYQDVVSGFLHA